MKSKSNSVHYGENPYGLVEYGGISPDIGHPIRFYDLVSYLPWMYRQVGINNIKLLDIVVGGQLNKMNAHIDSMKYQRGVEKATWGLSLWESELGLPTENILDTNRRQRIFSKLGGHNRTTVQTIKDLALNVINAQVQVGEDFENFHTDIIVVGMKGSPENIEFFKKTLEEIMPAHLTFRILTTKLTWDEFDAYGYTFNEWDSKNLSWEEFEIYEER